WLLKLGGKFSRAANSRRLEQQKDKENADSSEYPARNCSFSISICTCRNNMEALKSSLNLELILSCKLL
ncbi:MAG: hypothetical protein MPJ22_04430, partial [Pirellulales bacterium]|nr:hypothetical protein [Pirellulales bacterium]